MTNETVVCVGVIAPMQEFVTAFDAWHQYMDSLAWDLTYISEDQARESERLWAAVIAARSQLGDK